MNITRKKTTVSFAQAIQITRQSTVLAASAGILAVLLTAGCAGTAPKPQFSHAFVSDTRVTATDEVQVEVSSASNVSMLPEDKVRLAQKIKLKIDAKRLANLRTGEPRTYQIDLVLSRYEKGSAFARAMLAGLGQIHIEGVAHVYQMPEHVLVGEFDLAKTFAWGGIYGASTTMDDIENTFADGVAAAVTDQQTEKPKQKI